MDLSRENLPNLKSTIEERYPDVTVRTYVPSHCVVVFTSSQVTVIQADASDDKAISDVCQQALREQGRLDIFFANVSARRSTLARRVKASLYSGWSRILSHTGRDIWRDVHQCYANKCLVVSV